MEYHFSEAYLSPNGTWVLLLSLWSSRCTQKKQRNHEAWVVPGAEGHQLKQAYTLNRDGSLHSDKSLFWERIIVYGWAFPSVNRKAIEISLSRMTITCIMQCWCFPIPHLTFSKETALHMTSWLEVHYHLKVHVKRKSVDQTVKLVCGVYAVANFVLW